DGPRSSGRAACTPAAPPRTPARRRREPLWRCGSRATPLEARQLGARRLGLGKDAGLQRLTEGVHRPLAIAARLAHEAESVEQRGLAGLLCERRLERLARRLVLAALHLDEGERVPGV